MMAKPPKKPKPEEIKTDPGAWDRFENAVDAAVKSGPKHRTAPKSMPVDQNSGQKGEK